MKRRYQILIPLCTLLIMVFLSACNNEKAPTKEETTPTPTTVVENEENVSLEETEPTQEKLDNIPTIGEYSLIGEIVELHDDNFLMETKEMVGSLEMKKVVNVTFDKEQIDITSFQVGDDVEVFYDGLTAIENDTLYPIIKCEKLTLCEYANLNKKQLQVVDTKDDYIVAYGVGLAKDLEYRIYLDNIDLLETKPNDYIDVYYDVEETLENGIIKITPEHIKVLNYCPIDDPQNYKQMMYVEDSLYVNTGYVITFITCGTLDGGIEEIISLREVPSSNGVANFEVDGYQRINENYIAVPIDNYWYYFAKEGEPILDNYTLVYTMLMTRNVMGEEIDFPITPTLSLNEIEKTFVFSFDPLSSYLPYGHYEVEDDNLICKTNDGKRTYVFSIQKDTNTITFVENLSTPITFIFTDFNGIIGDGSLFFTTIKGVQ